LRADPGALPPAAETFLDRGGRPRIPDKEVAVSPRVLRNLLAAFKVDGPSWQIRMDEALAAASAGCARSARPDEPRRSIQLPSGREPLGGQRGPDVPDPA